MSSSPWYTDTVRDLERIIADLNQTIDSQSDKIRLLSEQNLALEQQLTEAVAYIRKMSAEVNRRPLSARDRRKLEALMADQGEADLG